MAMCARPKAPSTRLGRLRLRSLLDPLMVRKAATVILHRPHLVTIRCLLSVNADSATRRTGLDRIRGHVQKGLGQTFFMTPGASIVGTAIGQRADDGECHEDSQSNDGNNEGTPHPG